MFSYKAASQSAFGACGTYYFAQLLFDAKVDVQAADCPGLAWLGLGIRRLVDTQLPAFLASSFADLRLVTRILNVNGEWYSIPHASEALQLWQSVFPGSAMFEQRERQRTGTKSCFA